MFAENSKKEIKLSRYNSIREDRVNLLMIIIDEKLFYLAVKKLSALLRGITSKYNDGVCCINCLHSLITSNKLGKKNKNR